MTNLRVEHELLVCIARRSLDQAVVERFRQLLPQLIDWDLLFASASAHGLLPLLSHHLQISGRELIPEEILQRLKTESLESSRSNLYLLRELLRITQLFGHHGIRTLTFKGQVLGQMLYGDFGLRQAGDLDLLIAKQDFARAKDLLQSNSYMMYPQLTNAQQRSHLGFHCEIQFTHADQFSVVDLHWGLSPKAFPFLLPFEELWSRRQTVRLAGQSIEAFSAEDLLLYLCVHGAKHYWSRLEWIAGVAELVNSTPAIDWSLVVQRANETRSRKILSLGLLLASGLFALKVPQEVIESVQESDLMRQCAAELEETLFHSAEVLPTQIRKFRWKLQFMDRKRDAIKGFLGYIFVPTISDWQRVHVPDALFPLYYGMRPFWLLKKYGARRNT